MFFASDNGSGAPRQVIDAITSANDGYAMGYGADTYMDRVRGQIREIFEAPEAEVYLVATGTAANALALATFIQPWQTIYCHRVAHIEEDECNAPEFYAGGAKLTLLEGADGLIDADAFALRMQNAPTAVHHAQPGILSLTNLTERGSRYTVAQINRLAGIAKAHGLPVHLDGARFANALVAEGCTPAEMTWRAGVDVLSFGGTKNGLIGVEAVVIFDPAKAREFELRRKRGGHLPSKHRYLSAQMETYLSDGLWLDLAGRANAAAARLEAGLRKRDMQAAGVKILHPVGGNMLFVELPNTAHQALRDAGAIYYDWPSDIGTQVAEGASQARLVASWSTSEGDVDSFLNILRNAL
ncbi:threonine aldolase family protein [Pararhodobacter oceanensis]|uniref:threonine aldolase family protein n=1 Tax=Pararhodobacter oceanensis TaxID=2172121 RepID=UPI003A945457